MIQPARTQQSQDALRTLAELKAEHARLWYQLYGLLKCHGPNMNAMYHYPCTYTWTEAIAYAAQTLIQQGNHDGATWIVERSRDVNTAVQAMIDKMYAEIEYKGE